MKCIVLDCNSEGVRRGYCHRHYYQIRKYGKILDIKRHEREPNEINILNDIATMNMYDKKGNIVAETVFDSKYIPEISQLKWHLDGHGYAVAGWKDDNGIRHNTYLHQAIIHLSGQIVPTGYEIDHKDNKSLNNLENNLRIGTKSQNQHNSNKHKDSVTRFKGVSYHNKDKKFKAEIQVNGVGIYLGEFVIEEDAARAYNIAAVFYYGEFARINEGV